MRLMETLKSLGRRWYVVVAGLLLTLGIGYTINTEIPTTFEVSGSIILMPPEETVGVAGNPYLFLGGLNQAQDVLVRRASAAAVVGPVLEKHPGTSYVILPDRTTSTPIVVVTAEAGSSDAALRVRDDAMKAVIATLKVMQDEADVKENLRVHGQNLVVDAGATAKTKTKVQMLLVATGGGAIGTLLLAGLLDGWLIERKERKRALAALVEVPTEPGMDAAAISEWEGHHKRPGGSRHDVPSSVPDTGGKNVPSAPDPLEDEPSKTTLTAR